MAELRWNPMIKDWVMVASNRQNRPNMPKDWCPFCPGSGKVPDSYEVYKYDNDFPALSQNPPPMDDVATELYKTRPSYGKCEVILFSPDHHGALSQLSDDHAMKLVELWTERFNAMAADKNIKYVFIFENRGEMVGVSMPHPHGQMYGYSVVPQKIELELNAAKEHYDEKGECLFCRINKEEVACVKRIVCENEDFIAYKQVTKKAVVSDSPLVVLGTLHSLMNAKREISVLFLRKLPVRTIASLISVSLT